ncbi:MAG: hypothetical protein M1830_004632 [Pleopsidium flavum]|nr:MAG: hypothetical protein M1830_004632 [Pleopsidium flavum]
MSLQDLTTTVAKKENLEAMPTALHSHNLTTRAAVVGNAILGSPAENDEVSIVYPTSKEGAQSAVVTSQSHQDQVGLVPRSIRELQDFNAPPTLPPVPNEGSSGLLPLRRPRPSGTKKETPNRLMKELAPFNEGPKHKVVMTQDNLEIPGVWQTRYAQKVLNHKDQSKLPSPPKNLSVKRMIKDQILPKNKIKDQNAFGGAGVPITHGLDHSDEGNSDAVGSKESNESSYEGSSESVDDEAEGDSTYATHSANNGLRRQRTTSKPEFNPTRKTAGSREQLSDSYNKELKKVEVLYVEWTRKKERILELLASPGYSPTQSLTTEPELTVPAYHPNAEIPSGYNLTMEQGLYVFSPTEAVFRDFAPFLEGVEKIAGRVKGVVKVIIPKACLQSHGQHQSDSSNYIGALLGTASHMAGVIPNAPKHPSNLQAYKLNMALNENTRSNTARVYDVRSVPTATVAASSWRDSIEDHGKYVAEKWSFVGADHVDAWKLASYENVYPESKMLENFENPKEDALYAMDNDAVDDLRHALRCANPKLAEYSGNSLMKSKTRIPGIHSPYFYVSHSEGTPFGMHIEDFAAYSLNYLHCGAPKCWTVVTPSHHAKLEEILYAFLNPGERMLSSRTNLKPKTPPQCSQFLRHNSVYVPTELLQLLDIEYTLVAQHQGEMVITFPFAYHQGYNTGPNIAEAIGYASERWEVFIREKLYQNCHKIGCMVEPMKMDLDFVKASQGTPRSSQRISLRKRQNSSATALPATTYFERALRSQARSQQSPPKPKPGVFPAFLTYQSSLRSETGKRLRSGRVKADWEGDDGEWSGAQSSPEPSVKVRSSAKKRKADHDQGRSRSSNHDFSGNVNDSPNSPTSLIDGGGLMELAKSSEVVNDRRQQDEALAAAASLLNSARRTSAQPYSAQIAQPARHEATGYGPAQIKDAFQYDSLSRSPGAIRSSSSQKQPQPSVEFAKPSDDTDYLKLLAISQNPKDDDSDGDALYQAWKESDTKKEKETEDDLLAATANILKTRRGTSVPPLQMPTPAASAGNLSDSSPGGFILASSRDSSIEPPRRNPTPKPDYSSPWRYANSIRKR